MKGVGYVGNAMDKAGLAVIISALLFITIKADAVEPERQSKAVESAGRILVHAFIDSRVGYKDFDWASNAADDLLLSDVYARYAGVGFIFKPNQYVEGYFLALFEEFFADPGGDNFDMDEGWIKLQYCNAFLRIGKLYAPFAHESTFGVEDPLTWHFADTRKSGAELGYDNDYLFMSGTLINGEFDTVDSLGNPDDERIDDYVLHLHLHPLAMSDDYELEVGAGYLSDVTETGLDFGNEYLSGDYTSNVAAVSYYLTFMVPVTDGLVLGFDSEYIESGKFKRKNYVDLDGDRTKISSANIEVALFGGERWWAGAQYAMMGGFDWLSANGRDLGLTPTRFFSWGGFGGINLNDNASVALQFMSGNDDEGDTLVETYFQVFLEI